MKTIYRWRVSMVSKESVLQSIRPVAFLVWLVAGLNSAYSDTWASPKTREYPSSSGNYVARVVPAGLAPRSQSPTLTVVDRTTDDSRPLWTVDLGDRATPVKALVSDDGNYVVTLDNWQSVGYGDNVIAFYNESGLIKKYSLEEIAGDAARRLADGHFFRLFDHSVSSRYWRSHSLLMFDGSGDSTKFGIWLDWAQEWFAWRLSDGSRIELAGDSLKHWEEKGRQWARTQLQLPEVDGKPPYEVMKKWNEEARAWSSRKSARYGKKLTACRYLAFLRNRKDRSLLEQALASTERNENWTMELRITADRALAIHDGVESDFQSLRRRRLRDNPRYYMLGTIKLKIQLPEEQAKEGQVYVSVFSEAVEPVQWQDASAEYRLGKSLNSSSAEMEDSILELTVGPVRTGRYWAKAVWDKVGPHKFNLYYYEDMREWKSTDEAAPVAEEGDYESQGSDIVEVTAGETTVLALNCNKPGRDADDTR